MAEQNPYVGPRPFTLEDEKRFFGRSAETDQLLSLLYAHRLTLLIARSGVGKTSLLNAGLQPLARVHEDFEVLPPTRVAGLDLASLDLNHGGNIYVANAMSAWLPAEEPVALDLTLERVLRERPRRVDRDGETLARVVIIDQLEEVFTAYPALWQERTVFFEQLREALRNDSRLRVVLALREDYLADLTPYMSYFEDFNPATMRLEPLGKAAAIHAVTQPLETTGRAFDAEAATQLVEDLTRIRVERAGEAVAVPGQYVEPVQLQVVCRTLWDRLPPDVERITTDHLEEFGDVDDALMRFYEDSLASSIKAERVSEKEVREWFETELITAAGTRGTVNRGAEETGGVPNPVVDALENAHVVSGVTRHGSRWYELTHDRFVDPIRRSNEGFKTRRRKRRAVILGTFTAVLVLAFAGVTLALDETGGPAPLTPELEVTFSDTQTEAGNFGDVFVGEARSQSAVITNVGDAATPVSLRIVGAEQFTITDDTCQGELEPGGECQFTVQFEPTSQAGFSARLTLNSDAELSAVRAEVGLVGVGIGPSVSIGTDSIEFGELIIPGFLDATVEIGNNGRVPVVITDVAVGSAAFSVESACIGLIDPGALCTVTVRFEPSSTGSFTDSLVIAYEQLESTFVSLTGVASSAQVEVRPASFDFGSVRVGGEARDQFTIHNSGTAAVTLSQVELAGSRAGFGIIAACPVPRLLPNDSCVVEVVFSPESEGSSESNVLVSVQDDMGREVEATDVVMEGTGVITRLTGGPDLLEWRECFSQCGDSRFSQTVTLVNEGSAPPESGGFNVSIEGSSSFIASADDACRSLAPDDQCTIEVTYTGTSGVEEIGQLLISFGSGQVSIELRGVDEVPIP